jgi:hypothetical protein
MAGRLVIVALDPADLPIRRGPYLSADDHLRNLAPDEQVMNEADALAAGHTYPTVLATNEQTLRTRALTALAANATYLALSPPTTAQAVAQVERLTRECSGLIRLALNLVDSLDGT